MHGRGNRGWGVEDPGARGGWCTRWIGPVRDGVCHMSSRLASSKHLTAWALSGCAAPCTAVPCAVGACAAVPCAAGSCAAGSCAAVPCAAVPCAVLQVVLSGCTTCWSHSLMGRTQSTQHLQSECLWVCACPNQPSGTVSARKTATGICLVCLLGTAILFYCPRLGFRLTRAPPPPPNPPSQNPVGRLSRGCLGAPTHCMH